MSSMRNPSVPCASVLRNLVDIEELGYLLLPSHLRARTHAGTGRGAGCGERERSRARVSKASERASETAGQRHCRVARRLQSVGGA